MTQYFNNVPVIQPQVVSAIDDTLLQGQPSAIGSTAVAILGTATNGQPFTPIKLGSLSDALRVFGGGAPAAAGLLIDGCDRAFNPGGGQSGAPTVYGVRVNPAVQSTLSLLDGAAGQAIALTTRDWGAITLQYTVAVVAATGAGTGTIPATARKLGVNLLGGQYPSIGDNLGYQLLQLTYNGAGVATYSTSATTFTLASTIGGEAATFTLANYANLGALAAAITAQSSGVWSCIVAAITNAVTSSPTGPGASSPCSYLDVGLATVSTPIGTAVFVPGVAQACVDWLNGSSDPYWTAVRGTSGKVPALVGTTSGTGGTDGVVTNTQWQQAINALQSVDTGIVVVMTDTNTVQALVDSHCVYMSSQGKMERVQCAGVPLASSTAGAVAAAQYLNSYRTLMTYPGIQDYNRVTGILTTYPAYYVAAMIAGLAAGAQANVSLTNATIRCVGLEARSSGNGGPYVQSDYDTLLLGGVAGIQFTPFAGYRITQSLLTWTQDSLVTHHELSVRRAADGIARAVRQALSSMIGWNGSPAFLNRVASVTKDVLTQFAAAGWLVGDATTPAIGPITASIVPGQADTTYVSYWVAIGQPQNYILVTNYLTAFTGSVSS